jgi:hypothetical protein
MGTRGMKTPDSPSSNAARAPDDWIDALLLQDARDLPYIHDDGFTATVMQRLPAPTALPAWRRPIVAVLWLVAGVLAAAMLPQAMQDVAREAVRYVAATPVSLSMLAMLLAALGVAIGTGTALALRRD